MKARDLEDLLNKKLEQVEEKKKVQVQKLLVMLRNQSLGSLLVINSLFLGLWMGYFRITFLVAISSVLLVKLLGAMLSYKHSKKK